jgi:hypothetical protein
VYDKSIVDIKHTEEFELYAAKHYTNPRCISAAEFHDDLSRFSSVKRLLKRYVLTGILRERLLLNHLVVIHNVFSREGANRILFERSDPSLHSALKTCLVFLNLLPDHLYVEVPLDKTVVNRLRLL